MELWKLLEFDTEFFKLEEHMALKMEMKLEFLTKVVQMMEKNQMMMMMSHLKLRRHLQKDTNATYNRPCKNVSEMHYGFGTQDEDGPGDDMASTRLRSRNDDECDGIPQPKAMPKHWQNKLAVESRWTRLWTCRQSAWWVALNLQALWAHLCLALSMTAAISCAVCLWRIMPVPGAPDALDDYRWDQIMQGIGPESLVVLNRANLSNYIPLEQDPQEQRRLRRLLRNLQNLLVKYGNLTPCGSTLWVRVKRHAIHHGCIVLCTEDTWKATARVHRLHMTRKIGREHSTCCGRNRRMVTILY